tara:strand:- start:129 stop:722 length:594 start_codon:yes stop_codon:yes gene_type:complete
MKTIKPGIDNKKLRQKGLTLIEALISTVIVGIGFVAVFQMVNYSVQSIGVSSDRSKINYLSAMIVEDLIGDRFTDKGSKKMYEHLADESQSKSYAWQINNCNQVTGNVYRTNNNAYDNKSVRWEHRVANERSVNCRSGDVKNLKVFEICKDSVKVDGKTRNNCHFNNNTTFDKVYIGRTEIKINSGKKTKFLYFRVN